MKTLLKYLIQSLPFLSTPFTSSAQTSSFSYEMPLGSVTSLTQEQTAGYIWIGTKHGLSIYNGSYYRNLYASGQPGRLDNDEIYCLMSDSEGRVWIGNEGGLAYYEDGIYHRKNGSALNPVNKIMDMDTSVVAMGKNGFAKFSKHGLDFEAVYSEPGLSWSENMAVSNGEVWFTTEEGNSTFLKVLDANLKPIYKKYLGNYKVRGICEGEPNRIWIATDEGLLNFESRSMTQIPVPKAFEDVAGSGTPVILCRYKENSILLGIAGSGLYSLNTRTELAVRVIPGLRLGGSKYKCLVDRDFNIWIASDEDGLKVWLEGNQPENLSAFMPKGAEEVSNLGFDKDGRLWLRVDGKILATDSQNGGCTLSLPGNDFTDLKVDRYGKIWAVRGDRFLERYEVSLKGTEKTGEWRFSGSIFTISEAHDGSIWLSGEKNLERIGRDDKIQEYRIAGDMPFTFITNDEDGQIYMFMVTSGIMAISPDGSLSALGDSTISNISSIYRSKDGSYWLGTFNKGLIHYDDSNGETTTVGISSGLSASDIRSIAEDGHGNIWFSSGSHILKYDPSRNTVTSYHDNAYTAGMSYSRFASAVGPDGRIYFGGSGGVSVIDPENIGLPSPPAPIFMEDVSVNGQSRPRSETRLRLSHKENDLSFHFASLDFENGKMLSYSYMLKGLDKEWRYAASGVPAVYTHVPHGRYTFLARVRSEDGQWSEPQLGMPIRIRPSVWGTVVAKIIYLLIIIGIVTAAYKSRVVTLRQRAALENSRQRILYMEAERARAESVKAEAESVSGNEVSPVQVETVAVEEADGKPEVGRTTAADEKPKTGTEAMQSAGFLTEADAAFLAKVQECMEKNISDPAFSMKTLAENVFMSYSSLYSKMKTLTGKTPQIYFSDYRMEKAMELLTIKGLSVTEVSEEIGFASASAFSREFKNHYGIPPSKAKFHD